MDSLVAEWAAVLEVDCAVFDTMEAQTCWGGESCWALWTLDALNLGSWGLPLVLLLRILQIAVL